MDLIRNDVTDDFLDPRSIRFKDKAWCAAHNEECRLPFAANPQKKLCVLGPPCIIFSRQDLKKHDERI